MNKQVVFPTHKFDEIQKHPENYRLVEAIPLTIKDIDTFFPIALNEKEPNENVKTIVFLDTETTGLSFGKDKIIELGMVKATYSIDRNIILSVDDYFDGFEDPGQSLSPKIIELTGITDEMVQGKAFDDEAVASFLNGVSLIIAHNATFDRNFFDRRFQSLQDKEWACSLMEIGWKNLGYSARSLELLNLQNNFFYEAHRAYVDCLALLWILYCEPKAFSELIQHANTTSYKVVVKGNTFKINNDLKRNEFKFDPSQKNWAKIASSKEEVETIKATLDTYKQGETFFEISVIELNAKNRYRP